MSNSVQHKFSLVQETAYGVTPANPELLLKPIIGTTLALAKGTLESGVINSNRQVTDVRHGNRQVGGEVSSELSFGNFDDMLEAVLCGTWTDDVLVPGTVRRSFSILRQFTELSGAAKPYQLTKGAEFSTMSISITPEAFVKIVFGVFGREVVLLEDAPAGSDYTPSNAFKPFDSFTGTIQVNGDEIGQVSEIQLSVENGVEPRFVVFNDKTLQGKFGKTRVTGSMTIYFLNSTLLQAFYDAEKISLEFSLTDLAGNSYAFLLPSLLPNGGQTDVEGDSDVTINIPFQSIFEQGAETEDALTITRVTA